jgi:hypothetical protein
MVRKVYSGISCCASASGHLLLNFEYLKRHDLPHKDLNLSMRFASIRPSAARACGSRTGARERTHRSLGTGPRQSCAGGAALRSSRIRPWRSATRRAPDQASKWGAITSCRDSASPINNGRPVFRGPITPRLILFALPVRDFPSRTSNCAGLAQCVNPAFDVWAPCDTRFASFQQRCYETERPNPTSCGSYRQPSCDGPQ